MSEQLTIPASSIRGKDWTKLSLDTLENGPNPAQEPRLKKRREISKRDAERL